MDGVIAGIVVILLIALYFLPWLIAEKRKKRNSNAILLTNLLFGWTLIGWVVALIWAVTVDAPAPQKQA